MKKKANIYDIVMIVSIFVIAISVSVIATLIYFDHTHTAAAQKAQIQQVAQKVDVLKPAPITVQPAPIVVQNAIPELAIARKGDGIERIIQRQIIAELKKAGQKIDKKWVGREAHRIVVYNGYAGKGWERRIKFPNKTAYILEKASYIRDGEKIVFKQLSGSKGDEDYEYTHH